MKPIQVMIVEDEPIVGIDIRENLISFGYNVVGISSSGEEAIENAIKNRPEIILMDIQLNGELNGIETAKVIKNRLGIPVIYLTAFSDDKTLKSALDAGPSGYLLKPFIPRELHTSIQTALHKKTQTKETKLAKLSYIQRNILKRKNLLDRINTIQTHNIEFPQSQVEKKINRLKYIRDIISKRNNFEKLIRENHHYQENLETLLGGLLFSQSIDERTPYILPLNEIATTLEYTKEEIQRMGNLIIPLLIHREDFEIMENYFKSILTNPAMSFEVELRFKHKSGIYRHFFLQRSISNQC